MLRVKPGVPRPSDPIDQALYESVEAGLPWHVLIASAACSPEEAEMRVMKLVREGKLEGSPGPDARMSRATVEIVPHYRRDTPTARPPSATHPSVNPAQYGTPSARPESATYPSIRPSPYGTPPVRSPSATHPASIDAGRGATPAIRPPSAPSYPSATPSGRSSGAIPPINKPSYGPSNPPSPYGSPSASATYASAPPSAPSTPPFKSSYTYSSVPDKGGSDLLRDLRTMRGQQSLPPPEQVRRSSTPAPRTSSNPPSMPFVVDSPIGALISEFSQGSGMMRWSAARMREALEEELAGNFLQAVSILNVVLAQFEDARIRAQRDRLHMAAQRANSGVFRSRALEAERKRNHREAAEHWRKVVEALPADAEAAVHAAMCSLEAGDDKQAAVFAKKAVQLAPDNINAHRVLLRFFQKSGMEASAQREREILMRLRRTAK